jgi:hypothetical protein
MQVWHLATLHIIRQLFFFTDLLASEAQPFSALTIHLHR